MIPQVCLFALVCVLLVILLRDLGYKSAALVSVLGGIMILGATGGGLLDIFGGVGSFVELAGIGEDAKACLKAIGLGYIFGFTSEICSSVGAPLVASAVTLAGRTQIFLIAFPYIEKIAKLGAELLQ